MSAPNRPGFPLVDALRLVSCAEEAAAHLRALQEWGPARAVFCADRDADAAEVAAFVANRPDACRQLVRVRPGDDPDVVAGLATTPDAGRAAATSAAAADAAGRATAASPTPGAGRTPARAHESLVAGFYLDPEADAFAITEPRTAALWDAIAAAGLPIVVAAGVPNVSEALQVAALARRSPTVPVILTNGGQMNISGLGQSEAYLALAANPRLSATTTGVYRQDFLENVLDRHGAGRMLFATHRADYDVAYELARVLGARCPAEDRARVLAGTAEELFFGSR